MATMALAVHVALFMLLTSAATSSASMPLNVYRAGLTNELEASQFRVAQTTISQHSEQISDSAPSKSFLHCCSLCLENSTCAGLLYDKPRKYCHQLSNATGIKDKADEAGDVKAVLYGPDPNGKFELPLGECAAFTSRPTSQPVGEHPPQYDCLYWYDLGYRADGVYCINPDGSGAFQAFCDMSADGGGWTVFQRRVDGSENMRRNWRTYKTGFGELDGELWQGLGNIHAMTAAYNTELHVYMDTFEGESAVVRYGVFRVGDEDSGYELTVTDYDAQVSTTGDSMRRHSGMKFSTWDKDQDTDPGKECAKTYRSGWWFEACHSANLNGEYMRGEVPIQSSGIGVNWKAFKPLTYSLKTSIMKLRKTLT